MIAPSAAIDWISATNSTKPPITKRWEVNYSQNPAEIALNELASSLSDLNLIDLLEGLEETRREVFEKYYGSPGEND